MKGKDLTKILMSILLVIVSIAIIVIAFVGIYLPNLNKIKNIIPDYKLGTEVDGIIEYRLSVDKSEEEKEVYVDNSGNIKGEVKKDESQSSGTEVSTELEETDSSQENDTGYNIEKRIIKANEDSVLTKDNFEKTKTILEQRLEKAGATEYAIRLDDVTGDMVIELSQNDDVSYLYQVALSSYGEFDIIDYQTGVVLIDKTHLKNATEIANFDQNTNSYTIYLQIELDEEGTKLINEISKKYVQYTDANGESKTDYISARVDGAAIMTTYFGEPYTQSVINIPITQNVNVSDLNLSEKSVSDIAFLISQDTVPVKYTLNGNALFIESTFGQYSMDIFYWGVIIVLVVATIVLLIKFKARGLLAGIMNMTLIGLVIIILKTFSNVVVSISSMVAVFGMIALNLIFLVKYLNNLKEAQGQAYLETLKSFYSIMFPFIVIAFVFTFFASSVVAGVGSVLFWGMLLQIIYNTIIVKYVLEGK